MYAAHAARPGTRTRLCLPALPESLPRGRDAVRDALRPCGWGLEAMELAVLAVSEALTNAIVHGSRPGAAVEIRIVVAAGGGATEVRVTDRGRPGVRGPLAVPEPPAPSSAHGRGLIIMSALADELEIGRVGRGTRLHLRFVRPAPLPGAAEERR